MDLTRWNPYHELGRMKEELNKIFDMGISPAVFGLGRNPSVDVRETDNAIIVSAEVPGVNPEDLDITVNEYHITLKGKTEKNKDVTDEGYRIMERRYGSFSRTIPLPEKIIPEESSADYRNGLLEIKLLKAEQGKKKSVKLNIKHDHH
ncbi:MAG: hypothetical protein CVU88_05080 [Firmicutes bacterium HGW-Firmicutes-13]|nr:MAG: hypothetical protein CVU88_05080 [Firmicutes bacterium HGW-Firmicutes-13]